MMITIIIQICILQVISSLLRIKSLNESFEFKSQESKSIF